MAVALLSGFPVVASKAHNTTMTLSTPSHSASGACKLVLVLSAENAFNSITGTAITDSTGGVIGTWTRLVQKKWDAGTGFTDFGWAEIWWADCSGAYTSKTVTLTVTATSNNMMAGMALYAVTGFDTGTVFGGANHGQATADGATHLIASAITAQTTGGLIVGTGLDGNSELTMAMQTGTTQDVQVGDASAGTAIACYHMTAGTTAAGAYTVGTTKTDQYYVFAGVEIRAAAAGIDLAGTLTGAGTVAGALTTAIRPAGTLTGVGTVAGALTTAIRPAGTLQGVGTVSGALTTAIRPAGVLQGSGTVAGALTTAIPLAGSLPGAGTVAGALSTSIALAGVLSGAGTVSGTLAGGGAALAGAVIGSGTLAGALTTAIRPAGILSGVGTLSGALTTAIPLAGNLSGQGTISGTLLANGTQLAGTLSGSSSVSGVLITSISLAGVLAGTGTLTGRLQTTVTFHPAASVSMRVSRHSATARVLRHSVTSSRPS